MQRRRPTLSEFGRAHTQDTLNGNHLKFEPLKFVHPRLYDAVASTVPNMSRSCEPSSSSCGSHWVLALQKGFSLACVEAHGVDFPCHRSQSMHGNCISTALGGVARAHEYCSNTEACAGLMLNAAGDVATIKYKHSWLDAADAASHGWHVASGASSSHNNTRGLNKCKRLVAALEAHARTNNKCDSRRAESWWSLGCEQYVTNGRYGGSAMHYTAAAAASSTTRDAPPSLLVLLRGHAFRLGGQFTTGMTESNAAVQSQEMVLHNIRERVLGNKTDWRISSIFVDAVHPSKLGSAWKAMCERVLNTVAPVIVRTTNQTRQHNKRSSQAASLRGALSWVADTAAYYTVDPYWQAMLILRADVAFKLHLPLPAPFSAEAFAVHVPHAVPSCGGLTATPGQRRRVGDTFLFVPRELNDRLRYALEAKDEANIKALALHDLADWLPTKRLRFWLEGEYESNTAVASNPLYFQTGRDAATPASRKCSQRPISVSWGKDGKAVWAAERKSAEEGERAGNSRLVGSFRYTYPNVMSAVSVAAAKAERF